MKVAFIGTHGVGKTTLCYDLASVLKRRGFNVDMVKEVARLSPLPINRKTSLEAQTWILATQVAEEIRSASQHDVVVCDRSVHLLFKVPICGEASPDGVRDTDEFFMRSIDHLVDTLLLEKKLPYERLPDDQRDAWIEVVREIVLRQPQLSDRLI